MRRCSEGLGLDSIDALELGMAIRKYDIQLSGEPEESRKHLPRCVH
jgi:acyl carrier protein